MKSTLHSCLYLLLAVSLITAGLPLHALMANADTEVPGTMTAIDPGPDSSKNTGKGGCPHHAEPSETTTEPASEELAHECCGPDCRCACAGLTLLPTPRIDTPLSPPLAASQSGHHLYLPSLISAPLPRPPKS